MKAGRATAKALRAMGYVEDKPSKHGMWWRHPSGARTHMSGTPGGGRAHLNAVADARRELRRFTTTNQKG